MLLLYYDCFSMTTGASSAIRFFLVLSFFVITSLLNSSSWSNAQVLYEYQARHGVKMINGRPRHSQSQGSVERGNKYLKHVMCINHIVLTCVNRAWFELHRDVEDMIRAWQHQNKSKHWSEALGDVQFQKNTRLLFWTTFYGSWSCVSSTHNSTFSSLYKYFM